MAWKGIKLFFVLACMVSIFLFSNDNADQSNLKSDGVIVHMAQFLTGKTLNAKEREDTIEKYVHFIRKGAHFSIYLILGFLTISFVKEFRPITWREMFYAFLFAFFYACSDEFHQLFIPGRSGNIKDIGIDSLGAYFGILIYYLYYRIRRKIHE